MSDADEPSVSEDERVVCSGRPPADRWACREMIDQLPLEGACAECEMTFWSRLLCGSAPTKH